MRAMVHLDLKNKRALVCGASQGIGRAIAISMAQAGAQIVALARSEESLKSLLRELPGSGHDAIVVDVGDLQKLESQISAKLQSGPFHILVNNSGGPKGGALLQANSDEFLEGFRNHVLVSQRLAQLLVPGMKSASYGRIINLISTSVKAPISNLGVSNTIRGAMANWSKTLAGELGVFGITVNNVLPGYTQTSRLQALRKSTAERLRIPEAEVENNWKASIPLGRFAEPAEVAAAVCFLASPLASYVTGVNLPVDGGRTPSL